MLIEQINQLLHDKSKHSSSGVLAFMVPLSAFQVELRDATGSLHAICLGRNVEKLFPVTAYELKEKTNKNGITEADYLANIGPTESQRFLLKPYDKNHGINKIQRSLTTRT